MHKVPIVAYSEDGLSLIATQIGKPVKLDAFTSSMCMESLGHIGFAYDLIEVSADKELKQDIIMAVPLEDGTGHTKEKISLKYEWKPPLCLECHVFRHDPEQCPKHGKKQDQPRVIEGLKLHKLKSSFVYHPKNTQPTSKSKDDEPLNVMNLKNHFDALRDQDDSLCESEAGESSRVNKDKGKVDDRESDSEVEETIIENVSTIKGQALPTMMV
ncbi:trichome birefringence-like protein 3 [Tanacetum coccineum]